MNKDIHCIPVMSCCVLYQEITFFFLPPQQEKIDGHCSLIRCSYAFEPAFDLHTVIPSHHCQNLHYTFSCKGNVFHHELTHLTLHCTFHVNHLCYQKCNGLQKHKSFTWSCFFNILLYSPCQLMHYLFGLISKWNSCLFLLSSILRAICITHYAATQAVFSKQQFSQGEWPKLVGEAAL